jgi:lipopolysaccharide export system permease protein
MRLLDRYLLRELLIPLGYCLSGFLVFWVAFDLISSLNRYQESHLTAQDVMDLYLVRLPAILVILLPIALLLALLYALTNHARHNELTAIRAAGVSLARICLPYFVVGLLLSPVMFVMNEYWAPNSADREDAIMHSHQTRGAASTSGGFNNTRDGHNFTYAAFDEKTATFSSLTVIWRSPTGEQLRLFGDRAGWTNAVLTFSGGTNGVQEYRGVDQHPFLLTNVLPMPEFNETPDQVRREVRFAQHFAKPSAEPIEVPIRDIMDYLDLHPRDLTGRNKAWLETQLWGRLAMPWTCLVVVLIAIPFGAASGRRNLFAGVAGSIVLCFIYFVLLRLGLALGEGGYLPPWLGAWFPNISFSVAAIWLLSRVR